VSRSTIFCLNAKEKGLVMSFSDLKNPTGLMIEGSDNYPGTGGRPQQNLSRWLEEARSLPLVSARQYPVEQKARLLAEASKLTGEQLTSYLEQKGMKLADFERRASGRRQLS